MQIFVKTLNGKSTTINIEPSNTVLDLKKIITEKEGIAVQEQRLIYEGKQLDDPDTLASKGISDMSTIHLVLRLLGGGLVAIKLNSL